MTGPVIVTIDYLDVDGTSKEFSGDANAVNPVFAGIIYSDPNDPTYTQYLFPWARILRMVIPTGVYYNWGQ